MFEPGNLSRPISTLREVNPQRVSGDAISAASRGLRSSSEDLQANAQTIARANTTFSVVPPTSELDFARQDRPVTETDINQALIEQRQNQQVFNASAEVISVANENTGRFIDIVA